jgi:taurine--2-oxoglutarate transaminase
MNLPRPQPRVVRAIRAPTARLRWVSASGPACGSVAARGNLLILAPPLLIADNGRADALALLDRLLADLEWT